MKFRRILFYFFVVLMSLIIFLFFFRMISAKHLDDVTHEIPCSSDLYNKADVFYVIPNFENKNIAENKEWCKFIFNMGKEVELHGFTHTYEEFKTDRDSDYLNQSIDIFEKCFNKTPERFKAPQLSISKNNRKLIAER